MATTTFIPSTQSMVLLGIASVQDPNKTWIVPKTLDTIDQEQTAHPLSKFTHNPIIFDVK
jgi:hypothetical protein